MSGMKKGRSGSEGSEGGNEGASEGRRRTVKEMAANFQKNRNASLDVSNRAEPPKAVLPSQSVRDLIKAKDQKHTEQTKQKQQAAERAVPEEAQAEVAKGWFESMKEKVPTNPFKAMVDGLANKIAVEEFKNGIKLNRKKVGKNFAGKIDGYYNDMLSKEKAEAKKAREKRIFEIGKDEEFKRHSVIFVINQALQKEPDVAEIGKANEVSFFRFLVTYMTGSSSQKPPSPEATQREMVISNPVLTSVDRGSVQSKTFPLKPGMTQNDLEKEKLKIEMAKKLEEELETRKGNPGKKGPGQKT